MRRSALHSHIMAAIVVRMLRDSTPASKSKLSPQLVTSLGGPTSAREFAETVFKDPQMDSTALRLAVVVCANEDEAKRESEASCGVARVVRLDAKKSVNTQLHEPCSEAPVASDKDKVEVGWLYEKSKNGGRVILVCTKVQFEDVLDQFYKHNSSEGVKLVLPAFVVATKNATTPFQPVQLKNKRKRGETEAHETTVLQLWDDRKTKKPHMVVLGDEPAIEPRALVNTSTRSSPRRKRIVVKSTTEEDEDEPALDDGVSLGLLEDDGSQYDVRGAEDWEKGVAKSWEDHLANAREMRNKRVRAMVSSILNHVLAEALKDETTTAANATGMDSEEKTKEERRQRAIEAAKRKDQAVCDEANRLDRQEEDVMKRISSEYGLGWYYQNIIPLLRDEQLLDEPAVTMRQATSGEPEGTNRRATREKIRRDYMSKAEAMCNIGRKLVGRISDPNPSNAERYDELRNRSFRLNPDDVSDEVLRGEQISDEDLKAFWEFTSETRSACENADREVLEKIDACYGREWYVTHIVTFLQTQVTGILVPMLLK